MGDRRIRLVVISPNPAQRRRILDQTDPQYFEVVEHAALEELPIPAEGDTTPVVVVLAEEVGPSAGRRKPAVVAIGIQDVIPLESLTSMRLRDAAMASLARERRLEELKLERNRAIVQGEIASGLANARTGLEVLETLVDGLVALGCGGVSCWRAAPDRLELVLARGEQRTASADLPRSEHPAWRALESGDTVIRRSGALQLHVPLATGSGERWVVHATVEGPTNEARIVSLEHVVRHAAEALERTRLRQDLDAERDGLRALVAALRSDPDTPDVAALLEDAVYAAELPPLDVQPLELSSLLTEVGFQVPAPSTIELQGDPRALERALRALHRTLGLHTKPLAVRATADEHAAYVEVHGLSEDASALEQTPGFGLVRRVCAAHGGQAWIEDEGHRVCLQIPRVPRQPLPPTLSLEEARTPPSAEDDAHLDVLRRAFVSPQLGTLLDLWAGARHGAPLPHPDRLRGATLVRLRPDMVEASVQRDHGTDPTVSWTMVGPRLERRLGGTLEGPLDREDPAGRSRAFLHDLVERYRECTRTGRPTYDYMRQRGDDGWSFERLILPCTRDASTQVSDLVALVLFDGF